jgi:hypothetical protein
MGKRIDLRSRVDEATVASTPTMWDPKIARAVIQRREQQAARSPEHPASGTELIQARLAEARARQEAEARPSCRATALDFLLPPAPITDHPTDRTIPARSNAAQRCPD